MASLGLLTMLDDITALLDDIALMSKTAASKSVTMVDDVSTMTKVATQKTVGVLGDDLALNAQQVNGIASARELPVIWKVAKGSLLNKCILVPVALLISVYAHWGITLLLMAGGAYLCFEGVEKVLHSLELRKAKALAKSQGLSRAQAQARLQQQLQVASEPPLDLLTLENAKVKGAIRTDFILSAEITVIALGTVSDQPLVDRLIVLALIAVLLTAFVYGIVALIVRLDDIGFWFKRRGSAASIRIGDALINMMPGLMRALTVAGTIAMFLVGGSLLMHGLSPLQMWLDNTALELGKFASAALAIIMHLVLGWIVGWLIFQVVEWWAQRRERAAK